MDKGTRELIRREVNKAADSEFKFLMGEMVVAAEIAADMARDMKELTAKIQHPTLNVQR